MYVVIVSAIQCLMFFLILQILSGKAFNFKEGFIVILTTAIVASFLFLYIKYLANLLIIFVLVVFLVLKKKSIPYSITLTLITYIHAIVCDYLTSSLLARALPLGLKATANNSFFLIIHALSELIIAVLLAYLLHSFMRRIKFYPLAKQKKYGTIISGVALFTLIIFYVNIYQGAIKGFDRHTLQINTILFLVYFIVLIGILYMVTRTAVKELRMKNQQEQFKQLQEYTYTLEAFHKEMRNFRHDYVNMLSGLAGFMDENDMPGLKSYFQNHVVPFSKSIEKDNYKITLLQDIGVVELKGLIAIKLIRAQELNIKTLVEITDKINKINMGSIDLCRAVGILLDNAIEAALASKESILRLAIFKKQSATLIVLANTVPENMPPIHQIFQEGFSTKGKSRGIGLSSLREILKKYQNVFLDTKMVNGEFVQELEIS